MLTVPETVAIIAAIVAIFTSIVNALRNNKQDNKQDARQDATILTEIGYIKSSIDGVNRKLERQEERYIEVAERLTAVEASAKQAHKRIDSIEKKEHTNED